jgi:hypothetical protein
MNNIRLPSLCVKRAQTVNPIAPPPLPPATHGSHVAPPPLPPATAPKKKPISAVDELENRVKLWDNSFGTGYHKEYYGSTANSDNPNPDFKSWANNPIAAVKSRVSTTADNLKKRFIRKYFLQDEDAAQKINDIAGKALNRQGQRVFGRSQADKQLSPEQFNYVSNAPIRYIKAIQDVEKNQPNAFMPELHSRVGQFGTLGLSLSPAVAALLGTRAINTRDSTLSDLDDIHKDDFIPKEPGFWSYLLNGVNANTRENFINSLPADEYKAYLSNKAEDEKQRGWSQSRVIDDSPYNNLKERSMRPSFGNK